MPESLCPVSLGDWLHLCYLAQVPYVPGKQVASVAVEHLLWFDSGPKHATAINDAIRKAHQAHALSDKTSMLRWDACSPQGLKDEMSKENNHVSSQAPTDRVDYLMHLHPSADSRFYSIASEYPRERMDIWLRPWISALYHLGYPVEYRAFVEHGKVIGISSYYPQRVLRYNAAEILLVKSYTERLISYVQPPLEWHHVLVPERLLKGVHFTADFLVTEESKVLFLEGGPPFGMGAHPCCFEDQEIEGLALKPAKPYRRPPTTEELLEEFEKRKQLS